MHVHNSAYFQYMEWYKPMKIALSGHLNTDTRLDLVVSG